MPEQIRKPLLRPPRAKAHRRLRPLNEYPRVSVRTKLLGLRILQRVCKNAGARFWNYRLYTNPTQFSIRDFGDLHSGRLVVRTDPRAADHTQEVQRYKTMLRGIFSLDEALPDRIENRIRGFMRQVPKSAGTNFIVHKARPLSDYDSNLRITIDFSDSKVIVSTGKVEHHRDTFRFADENRYEFRLFPQGIAWGKSTALSEKLRDSLGSVVKPLIAYAKATGHEGFEVSATTYKDAPESPEFYDLILGRP